LADLGYLCANLAERGDPGNVMTELQPVTREAGFPSAAELAERYAQLSGRSVDGLAWYRVLAVWKSAIFLEPSYKRYLSGTQRDTAAALGREVEVDPRFDEYRADDILAHHSAAGARLERSGDVTLTPREFQDVLERALLAWIAAGEASPAPETWPAFAARVAA